MKTHQLFSLTALTIFCISCGGKSGDANEESIEAQNEMSGQMHENDTNLVKRDGTLLDGTLDSADTISLPPPVLEVITMDKSLSVDKITNKRMFEEDNVTYYEVTFRDAGEQSTTLIFDQNGKKQPSNLKN